MWETIKKILQKQGGTCIIIEDGKPRYVVTNFDDYENLIEKRESILEKIAPSVPEQELLEKINQEITDWKTGQAEQQAAQALEEVEEEVKIEDLPL